MVALWRIASWDQLEDFLTTRALRASSGPGLIYRNEPQGRFEGVPSEKMIGDHALQTPRK